jgi:putative FmdB family regulatory protein
VPVYELRCDAGHRFEVLQAFTAPLPACACGAVTTKLPSAFGIGGTAAVPPAAERMPQTWRGTYNADREYMTTLRRTAEARRDLEDRHPELAGDRRPIVAHEGSYEGNPLRAGDAPPHAHGHTHGTHPSPVQTRRVESARDPT